MTIARRLLILLAIPVVALLGLGWFTGVQLAGIEARSRFVAENQIGSLVTLAAIDRSYSSQRIIVRNHLLSADPSRQAQFEADFLENSRDRVRHRTGFQLGPGGRER